MRVTCEQCQFSAEVPDSYADKTIKCPKCGAHIAVAATETFTLVEDSVTEGDNVSTLTARRMPNKSQSATTDEKNVDTLRLEAGVLELTTRHLRGQMTMSTAVGAGAYETRHETLDTLLSNITGVVVTKALHPLAWFAVMAFGIAIIGFFLGIVIGLSTSFHTSDNKMPLAFLIGGVIATVLGFIIPKSIEVVELQIMGNSKIITLSGGEENTRTRRFIEKVMATKKAFEDTL